ncbi:MAG: smalltalk protein [Bacteroidaceae bacterium]|nr:smalltalk protein [Bacteroidaceae bacterium]
MEEGKKKVIAEVIRFIITVLGALLGTLALQSCGLL